MIQMEWYWCLLFCYVLHIFADYYLQGILANMKWKHWWMKQEYYCDKYRNDYISPLIEHSIEWTVVTFIPLILVFGLIPQVFVIILINAVIHGIVDDLKANRGMLNLNQDQILHLIQIVASVAIAYVIL